MKFRDITPLQIRFPTALKEKIEESSKKNCRSMNAEVLAGMSEHYENDEKYKNIKNFTTGELLEELIRRFGPDGITIQIGRPPDAP